MIFEQRIAEQTQDAALEDSEAERLIEAIRADILKSDESCNFAADMLEQATEQLEVCFDVCMCVYMYVCK